MIKYLLSIFLFFFLGTSSKAFYSNEQSIIEADYEKKAQKVLQALFPRQDVSVVVTVKLNIQESELTQFREELELKFNPNISAAERFGPGGPYGDIHKLKENVNVNIIFNSDVPTDKKDLVYKLIVSKLHLNTNAGDRVNLLGSSMNAKSMLPSENKTRAVASVKEGNTNYTYVSIGILVIFFVSILYILFKFRENKFNEKFVDEMTSGKIEPSIRAASHIPDNQYAVSLEENKKAEDKKRKQLIDDSYSLLTEYPNLCIKVFIEQVNNKNISEVVGFFEEIGWSPARRLMVNLPPNIWSKIGSFLNERTLTPSNADYLTSLGNIHRKLTARIVSQGGNEDLENPFNFIFTLSYGEKKYLYSNLTVENIATISIFSNEEDIKEIFSFLKSNKKVQVIMKIAELKEMTKFEIKSLRNKLLGQLTGNTNDRFISANGSEVAAKILKGLSPEKEAEILRLVKKTNKKMANQLNRYILNFENIVSIPLKYQNTIYDQLEVEDIVVMLYGATDEVREFILSLLPKNKSMMVASDLEKTVYPPSQEEISSTRRDLVRMIEQNLLTEGEDLLTFQKSS